MVIDRESMVQKYPGCRGRQAGQRRIFNGGGLGDRTVASQRSKGGSHSLVQGTPTIHHPKLPQLLRNILAPLCPVEVKPSKVGK